MASRCTFLFLAGALFVLLHSTSTLWIDVNESSLSIFRADYLLSFDLSGSLNSYNATNQRGDSDEQSNRTVSIESTTMQEMSLLSSMSTTTKTQYQNPRNPYAYAFVVGGCDPDKPAYRFFLYNILVSTRLLRESNSTADIVVFVQLKYNSSHQTLPMRDIRLLHTCNIFNIRYIPKTTPESYYHTQFQKFRVLGLTEYDRVMVLDADVMSVSNLDYLFHLSTMGVLKENLVLAGPISPANGGFFMVTPGPHHLEMLNEILETRERLGKGKGITQFDKIQGWGHQIVGPDYWVSKRGQKGREWDFYAAFADQGLLYHWVKYAQKSVSIVVRDTIEHWGPVGPNDTVALESSLSSASVLETYSNPLKNFDKSIFPVYRDHVHFGGVAKPWLHQPPSNLTRTSRLNSPDHLWYWTLMELDSELKMDMNFQNWTAEAPPLGLLPKRRQAARTRIRLTA